MKKKHGVFLISDSTGELGERFINALSTQFPDLSLRMQKHNFVQTPESARAVVQSVPEGAVLFHTVMARTLKRCIDDACAERKIRAFDLTGPPTDFIAREFRVKPILDVTTVHRIDAAYERRIDAIEFTMSHDDGAGGATLRQADAILLGPSRVSKTPTSVYLALKGYRLANIPLIRELGEPKELEKLKGDPRVIGLVIEPVKLREVRLKRVGELGVEPERYADSRNVVDEMRWVREVYRRGGWKTIDVTDRAIEETAALVIREIQRKKNGRRTVRR